MGHTKPDMSQSYGVGVERRKRCPCSREDRYCCSTRIRPQRYSLQLQNNIQEYVWHKIVQLQEKRSGMCGCLW